MAQSPAKLLEGIFAVNKPQSLSSAQVLRDLQHKFSESKIFAPLLQQSLKMREQNSQKRKRHLSSETVFKMGHGGTLDPLATGILIVGLGRGTKHLIDFLECKKTYETVVLFGKSTTTYDVAGRVVAEAPVNGVTRETVEEQLENFRGKLKQIPPIYSAIKIDGMKLYDYARSGKELPRELESRDVEVTECTLLDFYEAGQHEYRYPAEQASEEEKATAGKLMQGAEATKKLLAAQFTKADAAKLVEEGSNLPRDEKAALHTHPLPTQETEPAQAPAARIRLTVSSGFYVRSFAHDLGISCGSLATMAALARSRQAQFTTVDPAPDGFTTALTYDDIEAGEDVWAAKISPVLEQWLEDHPTSQSSVDARDLPDRQASWKGGRGSRGGHSREQSAKKRWRAGDRDESFKRARRRNSSSPEA